MEMEKQVCSLEQAERLSDLVGVKQESAFYWCEYTHPVEQESAYSEIQTDWLLYSALDMKTRGLHRGLCFSAFTVAELITLLQTVAKQDIIIALDDKNIANTFAEDLCTRLETLKASLSMVCTTFSISGV